MIPRKKKHHSKRWQDTHVPPANERLPEHSDSRPLDIERYDVPINVAPDERGEIERRYRD